MKSPHAMRLLTLAALACLAGSSALAQQDGGYPYVGLSGGKSTPQFNEPAMANSLHTPGVTTSTLTEDKRGKSFKLFGGYQFNRNIGLEAGYFDLGQFGFSSTTAPAGTLNGTMKVHGFNLDLVGTMPLTDRLSALARVGAQYAKTNDRFTGTGAAAGSTQSRSERGTNLKYGAGLQYEVSPSMWLRGEVERYRIADGVGRDGHVNAATLSLVFPFGRSAAPAPRPLAAAYVAPPPPPAPAPVMAPPPPPVVVVTPPAPPAPPVRRRVSFSAESLFGFDKSELRPEGRSALDKFAQDLAGSQYDVISVEGHTDRLGSTAYNQKLSMQRAEAVKGYLVSSGRVDAAKVSAQGKGEMAPVTKPEDCKGNKPNPKLITCLQPDRRVDIEVVGTR